MNCLKSFLLNNATQRMVVSSLLSVLVSSSTCTWATSEVTLLNLHSPTNLPFRSEGPDAAIKDPFSFDPLVDYADSTFLNSAQQGTDIPQTAYASPLDIFMPIENGGQNIGTDATNFLNVDVSFSAGQSLDCLDLWGRTDYSFVWWEERRHHYLAISFYDDIGSSSGSGALLDSIVDFDGVTAKDGSNTPGSACGRLAGSTILNSAQRNQTKSFEIEHVGTNHFLLFAEIRAASLGGVSPGANPVLVVDRATGEIVLTNESIDGIDLTFTANSVQTTDGTNGFVASRWASIADAGDANNGGSIDSSDNWFEFSAPGSTSDLSESNALVGDGVTLPANEGISLGRAWRRNSSIEDFSIQLVNENDQIVQVTARFEGDFLRGDFDFDKSVIDNDLILWEYACGIDGAADIGANT